MATDENGRTYSPLSALAGLDQPELPSSGPTSLTWTGLVIFRPHFLTVTTLYPRNTLTYPMNMTCLCILCAAGNHQQHRICTCFSGAGYGEAPLASLYQHVCAVQFAISADKIVGRKRAKSTFTPTQFNQCHRRPNTSGVAKRLYGRARCMCEAGGDWNSPGCCAGGH